MTIIDKEKVTLTLPTDLIDAVRERTSTRGHSRFIADAIAFYLDELRKEELKAQLIAGYQANAERDLAIAEDWRSVENDALEIEIKNTMAS